MKSKIVILGNDFHARTTQARLRLIDTGRYIGYYRITPRQAKSYHDRLCGSSECVCGDELGQRSSGNWDFAHQHTTNHISIVNQDYDDNYIVRVDK